jgi:hypothetical protein
VLQKVQAGDKNNLLSRRGLLVEADRLQALSRDNAIDYFLIVF